MLRIKADRWQDFCNKAEELDFIPHDFEYRHTGYGFGELWVHKTTRVLTIKSVDMCVEGLLYDLITLGYVEKI